MTTPVCDRLVIPFLPVFLLLKHCRHLSAARVQLQLGYIYRIYRSTAHTAHASTA